MKEKTIGVIKYFVLAIIILIILVPLIWILSLSLRYPEEVFEILPTKITFGNFPKAITQNEVWVGVSFARMVGNSLLVSTISIIGIIIISILAAFGFSNYNFPGKESIFIAFLLSFMLPVQVLLIPLFFLMKNMGLIKSYLALILPYIAFGFPVGTLILRSFFEKIPVEIKEAAIIDGAGDTRVLFNIVLPLARPAIATVIIFSFLTVWNEFLFALVFIREDTMQTIPVVLSRMIQSQFSKIIYEVYSATIVLTMIPTLIIFVIFQKWFIAGLSAGAVKG
ncbi:MAG: carbohydrate ABC transporter permease [Actinobacteria bacterium]|nr:carbohydrate ABC transporter permease [Actinomycetota bacterium]